MQVYELNYNLHKNSLMIKEAALNEVMKLELQVGDTEC